MATLGAEATTDEIVRAVNEMARKVDLHTAEGGKVVSEAVASALEGHRVVDHVSDARHAEMVRILTDKMLGTPGDPLGLTRQPDGILDAIERIESKVDSSSEAATAFSKAVSNGGVPAKLSDDVLTALVNSVTEQSKARSDKTTKIAVAVVGGLQALLVAVVAWLAANGGL